MLCHLVKTQFVEAAHCNVHATGPQARVHGHTYRIEILASGEPDPDIGWIVDFRELKKLCAPIIDQLDHCYLNEVNGLEQDTRLPALQRWINERLQPWPGWCNGVRVSIVGDCAFRPVRLAADPFAQLPERLRCTFEAAQSLSTLPLGHACLRLHGHSYRLEVGARQLDRLAPDFEALYLLFDHRQLNHVPGLDQATTERLCRWIWNWLASKGHEPTVVVVQETEQSRCVYYGD